jgi:hypothetical protein
LSGELSGKLPSKPTIDRSHQPLGKRRTSGRNRSDPSGVLSGKLLSEVTNDPSREPSGKPPTSGRDEQADEWKERVSRRAIRPSSRQASCRTSRQAIRLARRQASRQRAEWRKKLTSGRDKQADERKEQVSQRAMRPASCRTCYRGVEGTSKLTSDPLSEPLVMPPSSGRKE